MVWQCKRDDDVVVVLVAALIYGRRKLDLSWIPPEKRRQLSRQTDDRFDFSGTQKQKKR